jgi:hypothetical protein
MKMIKNGIFSLVSNLEKFRRLLIIIREIVLFHFSDHFKIFNNERWVVKFYMKYPNDDRIINENTSTNQFWPGEIFNLKILRYMNGRDDYRMIL